MRGKAPAVPSGTSPAPWPQPSLQLRYRSLCNDIYRKPWPVVANPQPGGGVEYGCADDDATTLDDEGNYAFVVAPERQRAYRGTLAQFKADSPRCR